MHPTAPQPSVQLTLKVLSGPDKGAVYKLVSRKVMLGRGSSNDVVIAGDPKVSREHAKISVTEHGIILTNLSGKNKMLVNGQEEQSVPLESGTNFTLGDTQFAFEIQNTKAELAHLNNSPSTNTHQEHKPPKKHSKKSRTPLLIIIVLLLFLLLILSETGNQSDNEPGLRTQDEIKAEIQANEELVKTLKQQELKSGKRSVGYKQAQSFFVRGFRDYQKGQFERAMESFQACLSAFPAHNLCKRYSRLSQKRYDELVQFHMIIGRQQREKAQYKNCVASFRNVMIMIKNRNSEIYKEAYSNYKYCKLVLESRF